MLQKHFESVVLDYFGFECSPSQAEALEKLISFFFANKEGSMFVLRGYAGTGKTSLVAALIKALLEYKHNVVLLAPTGRAAKVFSMYAGISAFTIHKKIYRQKSVVDGEGDFNIAFNKDHDTLFLVDEASMISNSGGDSNFGSGRLLDDLVEYVYNGRNNRLVLIGDIAQLPPIGLDISPALDGQYLNASYYMDVVEADMNDVMRQAELSGILYNATSIRNLIGNGKSDLSLRIGGYPDVFRITGADLLEELDSSYGKYGVDETMVVCYSNKRANKYNEGIRRTILYREEAFSNSDKIMVVKNNYFWGKEYDAIDFIANGDIATVLKVRKYNEVYGFRFVNADLSISGYEEEINAWLLMDTLTSDYPALTYEESKTLYRSVEADYMEIASKKKRLEKIRENAYYNALQIKFAYAVTCHKAQGGQWDVVFIDQGWLPEEMLNDAYWRWLYTAVTRARKKLYFVNFKADFFKEEKGE
ncbi:AAA family ATPase [Odoribacter sp. OttesenSCG-928-J03]|nr:AAA family ATPase [Odoribacter sp. OttesenSCG-928-J03]MDL2330700.1 AAA family ATPase [Odoribacter sp. OttesenSCG-928-A06]